MQLLDLRIAGEKREIIFQSGKRAILPFAHSEWLKVPIFAFVCPKNQLPMRKHLTVEQRYAMDLAQRKAEARQKGKRRRCLFTEIAKEQAKEMLERKLSPEQVAGRCKVRGIEMMPYETFYKWAGKANTPVAGYMLTFAGKGLNTASEGCEGSRSIIRGSVDISQREAVVGRKERMGDLEIDSIAGKGHKGAAVRKNDRAAGYLWIRRLSGKEAAPLAGRAIEALLPYRQQLKAMTADNGKEFAKHERAARQLEINFYFCKPYHPWERGANENTNGLIRQYISKGTDFCGISGDYVAWGENQITNRSR